MYTNSLTNPPLRMQKQITTNASTSLAGFCRHKDTVPTSYTFRWRLPVCSSTSTSTRTSTYSLQQMCLGFARSAFGASNFKAREVQRCLHSRLAKHLFTCTFTFIYFQQRVLIQSNSQMRDTMAYLFKTKMTIFQPIIKKNCFHIALFRCNCSSLCLFTRLYTVYYIQFVFLCNLFLFIGLCYFILFKHLFTLLTKMYCLVIFFLVYSCIMIDLLILYCLVLLVSDTSFHTLFSVVLHLRFLFIETLISVKYILFSIVTYLTFWFLIFVHYGVLFFFLFTLF